MEATNPLNELGNEIDQILIRRGWSLRAAQAYTGVSFNVIDRVIKGAPVETHSIIKIAKAVAPKGRVSETVQRYLRLAGKQEIADVLDIAVQESHQRDGSTYVDPELARVYSLASPEDRALFMAVIRRIAETQAATASELKN